MPSHKATLLALAEFHLGTSKVEVIASVYRDPRKQNPPDGVILIEVMK